MTARLCSWCGQPLIQTDFNRLFYLYLCNNVRCRLFRQPQGVRRKDEPELQPEPLSPTLSPSLVLQPEIPKSRDRTTEPSYRAQLFRGRENYRIARLLGLGVKEAAKYRSQKRSNGLLERHGGAFGLPAGSKVTSVELRGSMGVEGAVRTAKRVVQDG